MQATDIGHGRGWLDAPAAASLARIDREIGHPLDINEAGRTWAQQDEFYQTYLRDGWPIALSPNAPSIHQLGRAIDTDEQNTPVLNRHGWFHTVYRNGVLVEPWHYEYDAARDQHINDSGPSARRKEGVMYIKGTRPDVYKVDSVWNATYPKGQVRMRLCTAPESAYATAGGLVVQGDDATLTWLGKVSGYPNGMPV
jgi:hypothetical protein